jgi:FkbM family methyltransferase
MTKETLDEQTYDSQATIEDLYHCYRLILGRKPDDHGWNALSSMVDQLTVDDLVLIFMTLPEFKNREVFRKMLGKDEAQPVVAQVDTLKLYVSPNDMAVGHAIHTQGSYEAHVAAAIKETLEPGMVFVDVGANIGYFSLLAAQLVGARGKVLAFEPNQRNCTLLHMSVALNNLANVEIYPYAVAERDASVVFDTLTGSNGIVGTTLEVDESQLDTLAHKTLVRSVRLDGILANLRRLDVIKMDIEGAEYRALVGAQQLVEKHRPIIFAEYSPGWLPSISQVSGRDLLLLFIEMGYTLSIIEFSGGLVDCGQDPDRVLDYFQKNALDHIDLVAHPLSDRTARDRIKERWNRLRQFRQE